MENPVIALFLALAIIIFASRIAGTVARQLGQPRVLGELIVGVVLGPTFLNFLHRGVLEGAHLEETIKELAELGVLILMFIVGLEVHLEELAKVGLVAIFAGVMGAIAPVLLAAPMLLAANYSWEPALFAGVTLAATSVSISAQVLLELGFLRTKEGSALLATALIDDVLAILLVSLTIAITGSEGGTDAGALLSIVGRMAVYLGGAGLIA
ncbi:MAG TPA: cation:proton antiporter, partial [Aggregatilineales bacterium]|nr:cation:proton antiporter [Aggregatilineales bacterium]